MVAKSEIHFAPPKKPWHDDLPLKNKNNNGFNHGLQMGLKIKQEGQTAGLAHVSTYQGKPFWSSGFLSHSWLRTRFSSTHTMNVDFPDLRALRQERLGKAAKARRFPDGRKADASSGSSICVILSGSKRIDLLTFLFVYV